MQQPDIRTVHQVSAEARLCMMRKRVHHLLEDIVNDILKEPIVTFASNEVRPEPAIDTDNDDAEFAADVETDDWG